MRNWLTLALASCAVAAHAELPENIKISGQIDGYYGYSWNKPITNVLFPRQYDFQNEKFRIASATANIDYTWNKLKFFATIWAGDNADLLNDSDPGDWKLWRNFRQLGVGFNAGAVDFTVGKFDTWMGTESTDSANNWNYGRGLLYMLAQPTYHSGIRAYTKPSPEMGIGAAVVSGWNESADGDPEAAYGAWLDFKLAGADSRLSFYSGNEGHDTDVNDVGLYGGFNAGAAGLTRVNVVDFTYKRALSEKTQMAFNTTWGSSDDAPNQGKWFGWSLAAMQQMGEKWGLGARLEMFEDKDGIRTGTAGNIGSFTLTYNRDISKSVRTRFEIRRDWSNKAFFESNTGFRKNQITALLAAEVKF